MYNIKIIRSLDEVAALKSEWDTLLVNSSAKTPYQRWEWNYRWIKGAGQGKSLYILTARNQKGELIGIAPFRKKTFLGVFNVLTFIGQETSSYPDFIVADDHADVLLSIFQYINDCSNIMGLDLKICEPSPSIDILREALQNAKWREIEAEPYTTRLLVNFGDNYERYLAKVSQNMRNAIRSSVKKLNEQFEVGFCAFDDTADKFEQRIKILFNLNARKWGGDPLKSHPGYREYFRASVNSGCFSLFTMSCDGVLVGAVGASLMDDTIFGDISGFDYSVAKVDLGKVFYYHLFRWAIENNFTKFDFLTGEEPYKLSYKPESLRKFRITAYKTTLPRNIADSYQWLSDMTYLLKSLVVKNRIFQNLGLYSFYKMLRNRKLHI